MIKKGHPILAKDINNLLAASYPLVVIADVPVQGKPFLAGVEGAAAVPIAFAAMSGYVFPDTTTSGARTFNRWPASHAILGGLFSGINAGDKVVAPNWWQTKQGAPKDIISDSQADAVAQLDASARLLGYINVTYLAADGFSPLWVVIVNAAGVK